MTTDLVERPDGMAVLLTKHSLDRFEERAMGLPRIRNHRAAVREAVIVVIDARLFLYDRKSETLFTLSFWDGNWFYATTCIPDTRISSRYTSYFEVQYDRSAASCSGRRQAQ